MKETKFRAWQEKMGIMLYSDKMWGTRQLGQFFDHHIEPEWPLMQFTCMKDSRGKDIYEGDIVRENKGYGSTNWEVVWEGVGFRLIHALRDADEFGVYRSYLDAPGHNRTLEVIGNIHENKEMLKAA